MGQFPAARQFFQAVLAQNPEDRTAQVYLERIQLLTDHGMPTPWTGVWSFTEK